MKKNTRQEILDAARLLFNKYGYNSVSLRDIAREVGISQGNLTYHFSKKENIVESLISESKDTFPTDIPQTLEELDAAFLDIQQVIQQNSYFFLHYTQLSQTSPEIYKKQRARYRELFEKFKNAFDNLHAVGLLHDELFPGEYDHAIDLLYMSNIYWAPFSKLKKSIGMDCVEYRRHAWSILYPFLTKEGRIQLQEMISEENVPIDV